MSRFIVSSVTGYPITPGKGRIWGNRKPATVWYVLDSAYCFQIVASYLGHGGNQRFYATRPDSETKAMAKAIELNEWDAADA